MTNTIKAALIIVFCCIAACTEQKTDIYRQLETVDRLSREDNYDAALLILDSLESSQLTVKESALYNILSIRLYGTHKYATAFDSLLNISEQFFKSENDIPHISETYLLKGFGFFTFKDQIDSCQIYLNKGTKLAETINDNYLLSQACWYKIHLYRWIGDNINAKQMADMQSNYAAKSDNKRQAAYAALNKAAIAKENGDTTNAIMELHNAITLRNYLRKNDLVYVYSNLGEMVMNTNIESAKTHFNDALKIDPDSKLIKIDMAMLNLKQGKIEEAEKLCKEFTDAEWVESRILLLKIQIGCQMAKNNLPEVINLQKQIVAEKDSMIKRIQDQKKHYSFSITKEEAKSDNNLLLLVISISLGILLIIAFVIFYNLSKKQNKSKELINELEKNLSAINKELAIEKELNKRIKNPGKELYDKIMADENCSQWNKPEMVCFLEYYNILHPEVLEKIESEFDNISTRDKIILLLIEIGKPKETILETLGLTESAYQTTMSRIKTKNAVLV